MSQDKDAAAVAKLSSQMLDTAATAQTHQHAMAALMAAYIALAIQHPCCTAHAAQGALTVSLHLADAAASRPPGTPVH